MCAWNVFVLHVQSLVVYISIQVEWSQKDGDSLHKGLDFGKVYGKSECVEIL